MRIDDFDRAILGALQGDGAMTNAALAEVVNLSASQCSRRRAALEAEGYITGYAAQLDARKLGFGLRAVTRVNLRAHGQGNEDGFARFIENQPEVRSAYSVSGDADYVLIIRVPGLEDFADFIHTRLLPHPQVLHVRSEIVLRTLKEAEGVDIAFVPKDA